MSEGIIIINVEVYLRDEVSDRSLNLTATCCSRGMLKFENDTVDNLLVYFSTCGLTRNSASQESYTRRRGLLKYNPGSTAQACRQRFGTI